MGKNDLWLVLIGVSGDETGRVPLPDDPARDRLPLRRIADEGLKADAAALVIVRAAGDATCTPRAAEFGVIRKAHHTLGVIGLRLHDYILWHGQQAVSLRLTGRL